MTIEHKSTRLGDLLVERGMITRDQLLQAIELQQVRRLHAVQINKPNSYKQGLGEVLVELGFINRHQLKSSLGWQRRLRKTTAAMVFIAPLLMAACGGGGGSAGATPQPITSQPSPIAGNSQPPTTSTSSRANSSAPNTNTENSAPSKASAPSQSSVPSMPVHVDGAVQIYWTPPNQRENGEALDITEVGGYELRYKQTSESSYISVVINDSYTDAYYFDNLGGDYEFEIAAFDTSGIYSAFVPVKPM